MKNWEIKNSLDFKNSKSLQDDLMKILLENRGIKSKKEINDFLNPSLDRVTPANLDINLPELKKSIKKIKEAIKNKDQIIIFGDYDADGISGSAILWETLNSMRANVMPYIPHRTKEGYGLSKKGIDNLLVKYPDTKLIITVDNGIVANVAVDYANSLKVEVIITDHHLPLKKLPNAFSIIHSTKVCGAAVAWALSRELKNIPKSYLELVALATVTDVMQLTSYNRILLKYGLDEIRKTKRIGLLKLLKQAGVARGEIRVYELGHVIGPRINAMGRIDEGMESLRLLCTTNNDRAESLANKLQKTNQERQEITVESFVHAKSISSKNKKIIIISDKSYNPGIIGLISGKITEEYYRPSIVVSIGDKISKGSARSVSGFNIIEFLRLAKGLLIDAGGHPGAAGFTIESKNVAKFKKFLEEKAEKQIDEKLLIKKIKIDCELPIKLIDDKLFENLNKLAPFGYGNPEPIFVDEVIVDSHRLVGKDRNHLKIQVKSEDSKFSFGGIMFGIDKNLKINTGDNIKIAYSVYENVWNGNKNLELKIKDIGIC